MNASTIDIFDNLYRMCQDPDCGLQLLSGFRMHADGTPHDFCWLCEEKYRIRRWRANNPERSKEINQKSFAKQSYKDNVREYGRRNWNNEKSRARRDVPKAVRNGQLIKPEHCELCDDTVIFAHHNDYSLALDVVWLCRKHHTEADRLRRRQERLIDLLSSKDNIL